MFGSVFGLVSFLVILGIMVLIHELGHFAMAKLFGVRVLAFSIGFGKRLFGVVHNGTDYKVCALPLGGYVMMQGETEMPGAVQTGNEVSAPPSSDVFGSGATPGALNNTKGAYVALTELPRWQRAIIALAGPVANFLLALVLMFFVGVFHFERMEFLSGPATVDYVPRNTTAARAGLQPGDTIVRFDTVDNPSWQDVLEHAGLNLKWTVPMSFVHDGHRTDTSIFVDSVAEQGDLGEKMGLIPRVQTSPIVVRSVVAGTPGAQAGLQSKDGVVAIDSLQIHYIESMLAYLRDSDGKPVVLHVLRNGAPLALTVHPVLMDSAGAQKQYRIGFAAEPPPSHVVRLPLGQAMHESWKSNVHNTSMIVQVLHGLFTRHVSVRSMSGPVGIEQQVSEAAQRSFWELMEVTAFISVNLGIFNLLPVPILDGGMLLFLLIESIARRDVDARIKERVYQAAFVCIMLLFVFIMFNDISKLSIFAHRPS